MRKSLFLAALFLMVLGLVASAATFGGKKSALGALDGMVLNTKGAPVAAAQVFREAADGTSPHVVHADADGHFHMGSLPAGLYELRAEAGGMWSEWDHNVLVRPGTQATVTLRLVRMKPPAPNNKKVQR